ncbi:Cache domain-containing protein [Paenibacillaceae bacterium GAS479]|nr:Cache domain-containing protein [Paenibacillaceae bacterium GAS479]
MKGLAYLRQRNSIFMKSMFTYILIFTIPMAVFGFSTYYWAANTIETQTNSTYLGLLEDAQRDVERNFNTLDTFAVQLSYMPRISKLMNMEGNSFSYDRVDIGDLLNSMNELNIYKSTYPLVDEIAIYFNGKDTVLSTLGKDSFERYFMDLLRFDNIDLQQWEQILAARNNHRIILPEQVSISNQPRHLLTYIQSLPPGDSSFQATLLLLIREEALQQLLSKSALAEQHALYIMDTQGNRVTDVNPNAELGSYIGNQLTDGSAVSSGIDTVQLADGSHYSLYRSDPDSRGWSYYIAVPTNTVLSKLHVIRNVAIGLSLFYLCLGLGLSYILAMRNYKPLANLIGMIRSKLMLEPPVNNEFHYVENAIYAMLTDANRSEHEISLYRPLARNTCLAKLLNKNSAHDASLIRAMDLLDISFPYEFFVCATLLLSEEQSLPEDFYEQIRSRLEAQGVTIFWVEMDEKDKAIILNMEREELRTSALQAIGDCLRSFSIAYRAIGVGGSSRNLHELFRSYEASVHAIEFRFLKGDGSILYAEEYTEDGHWNGYLAEENQLIGALSGGDVKSAQQLAGAIVHRYLEKNRLPLATMRYLGYSIASVALKALEQANIGQAPSVKLKDIMEMDTMDEMVSAIGRLYEETSHLLAREKEQQDVQLIREIKSYIHTYYNDQNLSLTKVAEAFRISSSYLSRYFKSQTGSTFIDYVNRRRIEASKPLLGTGGEATILQVAQQVGFDNDITFRRLFKKYMGMTPSQFKDK